MTKLLRKIFIKNFLIKIAHVLHEAGLRWGVLMLYLVPIEVN